MNLILEQVFCLFLLVSTSLGIFEIYAQVLTKLNIEKESFKKTTQNLLSNKEPETTYYFREISFFKRSHLCVQTKCRSGKIVYSPESIFIDKKKYTKPKAIYEKNE